MDLSFIGLLLDYGLRVTPGIALFAAALLLLPPGAVAARIALYIGAFVLLRDAMTPAGLWSPGTGLRLAFHPDPLVLASLGLISVGLVLLLWTREREMRPLLVWWRGSPITGIALGLGTGATIALPVLFIAPGGIAKFALPSFVAGMLVLAYLGNLLEEVLFRGYLQEYIAGWTSPLRAALFSGVAFAACHSFLALAVTDAGWPILAFTLAEGIACGLLAMRYGLVSATLAHGTAIFLIAVPMA